MVYIPHSYNLLLIEDKVRISANMNGFVHVRRKDDWYTGRRMPRMELSGKRKRGMPKMRFMDAVRERTWQ